MNAKKSIKPKSRSLTTVTSIRSSTLPAVANLLPNLVLFEDAPEISHLKIRRSIVNSHSEIEFVSSQEATKKQGCAGCVFQSKAFFLRLWAGLQNLRKQAGLFGNDLDDLDPVLPRTQHSLEFIRRLAELKSSSKSALASESEQSKSKGLSSSNQEMQRAYKAAFEGLTKLQQTIGMLKQLILILTFTRYAETPLTEAELNLTRGKTVIGSYVWVLTYSLQQLQDDADVEVNGYPANDLREVIHSIQQLVCQTVTVWRALTHTVETVEKVHIRVENLFTSLVATFPKNQDTSIATSRHIKIHRKSQRRDEELDKLKQYDAYKSAQTWARFSYSPLRILYRNGEAGSSTVVPKSGLGRDNMTPGGVARGTAAQWLGFDVLTTSAKIGYIKTIQRELNLIFHTVLNQLEKIDKLLHGNPGGKNKELTTIQSFEDGVILMGKHLEKVGEGGWTNQQIHDFLNVDKITLDRLDLITVSTATLRSLLHEARRISHISYEATRDLDYLECKGMEPYDVVVSNLCNEFEVGAASGRSLGSSADAKSLRASGGELKKTKKSVYDIEELNLGIKDAASQFERSIYQDILKDLPVFCSQRRIAFTLQDAEAVFTDSSHNMLSTQEHV